MDVTRGMHQEARTHQSRMATASRHDSFGMPLSSALAKFVVITIDPMIENNAMNIMATIPTVLLYRVCSKYSDCNRIERIMSDFVLDSKRKTAACLLYFQRRVETPQRPSSTRRTIIALHRRVKNIPMPVIA